MSTDVRVIIELRYKTSIAGLYQGEAEVSRGSGAGLYYYYDLGRFFNAGSSELKWPKKFETTATSASGNTKRVHAKNQQSQTITISGLESVNFYHLLNIDAVLSSSTRPRHALMALYASPLGSGDSAIGRLNLVDYVSGLVIQSGYINVHPASFDPSFDGHNFTFDLEFEVSMNE